MAGFLPGFMIGIGLMIYCYFFGPVGIRRPRATFGQFTDATKQAALPLMIPVLLLGGILTGWFTPTGAGVRAVGRLIPRVERPPPPRPPFHPPPPFYPPRPR